MASSVATLAHESHADGHGASLLDFGIVRDISTVVEAAVVASSASETRTHTGPLFSQGMIIDTFGYLPAHVPRAQRRLIAVAAEGRFL